MAIGLDTITKGDQVGVWPAGDTGVQEGDDCRQILYSLMSRVTPVVGEVRPANRSVKFLIRAK